MPPFTMDYSINIGSIASIVAILVVGYKLLTAINLIEFKVDLMWKVFERRLERRVKPAPRPEEEA